MRALIVDDELLVRRSLARALQSRGHTVIEAADGNQGFSELNKNQEFDLVILDVLMPGLSGPEVLKKWPIDRRSGARVVLISAFSGEHEIGSQATELGISKFIEKPFDDVFVVIAQLEELVGKGTT